MSGYRMWLEPASNLSEVKSTISSLAPLPIQQSLIRVGANGDGGYILPDDLDGLDALISPGVSDEITFDLEMARRGLKVVMADASVNAPPSTHPKFHFHRKFVDIYEDDHNIRLDTLCRSLSTNNNTDQILQMDIEGAEYRVLLDLSTQALLNFRIMIIEFHGLDKMFSRFPFSIIDATFKKLLRYHHVVHIHPNNSAPPTIRHGIIIPPVMEFTFYRKDRAKVQKDRTLDFPNSLDRKNEQNRPELILPACWR